MKIWKKSLIAKLSISFLSVSLLTVGGVGYLAWIQTKQALKQAVFNQLSVAATLKENEVDRWFAEQKKDFFLIYRSPEVQKYIQDFLHPEKADIPPNLIYQKLEENLKIAIKNQGNLQEIFLLSKTGKILFSTNKNRLGEYETLSRLTVIDNNNNFAPNFYNSPVTGETTIILAISLLNENNQNIGILATVVNLNEIDKIIRERTGLGESGETYLVGNLAGQNVFISGIDVTKNAAFIKLHSQGIDLATTGIDDSGLYLNYAGVPVIGVYRWLDNLNLALLAEMQADEAFTPANQLAIKIIIFGLISAILLGLGICLLALRISQPILAITHTANRIADGDLNHKVPVLTEDEVGLLADSFNQMTSKLKTSLEQLENYSSNLETTVQELKHTQAQLVHNEKMSSLGQLVAGIAHEINNPVNFIYGNIQYVEQYIKDIIHVIHLYQKTVPNPSQEIIEVAQEIDLEFLLQDLPQILSSMKIGSERIREIVLSLRNFSRLDEAEKKIVDIHEGIDSTLLILQHRLKGHGKKSEIRVIKEYGDIPLIECYPGQLNQVFMNILANAIDAFEIDNLDSSNTMNHNNTITIRTNILPEFSQLIIEIKDNGPGIIEDITKYLFDPFFTTKPVGKGTGLGLSISYKIVVEKHGGELKCFSEPGKGASFLILIPISQTK